MGVKQPILLIICLLLFACQVPTLAQTIVPTPGLIYKPALNGGNKILDPNGDGYVSQSKNGFTGNLDTNSASEISYKPFPVFEPEPTGDISTGPKGGHTDYANPEPLSFFYDKNNASFLFRVRLSGQSTASKGYSILIDTNETVTSPDKNPGFEYEVVLVANFDVRVFHHGSNTSNQGPQIFNGSVDQYSQKAVAATTEDGTPDYFYDFYVPLSAFNGGITPTSKIRMAGVTVTSGNKGFYGTLSDQGGVKDDKYKGNNGSALIDYIGTYPGSTPDEIRTGGFSPSKAVAPDLNAPIIKASSGNVTISGYSVEATGSIIQLYQNNIALTHPSVSVLADGTWSVAIAASSLTVGNTITATVKPTAKNLSGPSNGVLVSSCPLNISPPVIDGVIPGKKGFTGTTSVDGLIKIYNLNTGRLVAQKNSTNGLWSIDNIDGKNKADDGNYYATVTVGSCESGRSNVICYVDNNGGTLRTFENRPVINSPILVTNANITVSITHTNQSPPYFIFILYKNNIEVSRSSEFTTGSTTVPQSHTFSTDSFQPIKPGDQFYVKIISGPSFSTCSSPAENTSLSRRVYSTNAVNITGSYCGSTTVVNGISSEAPGSEILIYNTATSERLATAQRVFVDAFGAWTANLSTAILGNTTIAATVTTVGASESQRSPAITIGNPYTATTTPLSITGPVQEGATTLFGSAPNGTVVTLYINGEPYLDDLGNPVTATANTSNNWTSNNISPFALYVGASLTISVKSATTCESTTRSTPVIVQCRPIADTTIPIRFTQPVICPNTNPTVFMERSEPGIIYNLYIRTSSQTDDQAAVFSTSVVGTGKGIYLTSTNPVTFADNNKVVFIKGVKVDAPSSCSRVIGNPQYLTLTVLSTSKNFTLSVPASQQDLCPNGTSTVTVVGAEAGLVYQLFIAPNINNKVGPAIQRNTAGDFSFPPLPIASTTTYGLSISTIDNGCSASNNTSQNITIRRTAGPTVNQTVSPASQTVCQSQSTTPISFNTQSGYTYRVYDKGTGAQITSFTGNGASMSFSPSTSTLGTKTYRIEVTGAGCTSNLTTEPQVTVTNSATTPVSAGSNQTLCGAISTTLTGSNPAPGTGVWSQVSGPNTATFTSTTSATTTANGLISGTYVFRWRVTSSCGSEFKDVSVIINCTPTLVTFPIKFVGDGTKQDDYKLNDNLAMLSDIDGGIVGVPTVINGVMPLGTSFVTISNISYLRVNSLTALTPGTYSFTARSVDARGVASNTPMLIRMYSRTAPPPPLPVQLMAFTGHRELKNIILNWATASELDNDYFEVQRSSNSKDFETIGRVQGAGNSSQVLQYNFTDSNAGVGTVYYRLKQFDFSGNYTFSNVIAISLGNEPNTMQAQAYPNPFDNQLNLMVNSPASNTIVWELININGQILATDSMKVSGGLNNTQIPIIGLPKGMYIIKLTGKDINKSIKVIKFK